MATRRSMTILAAVCVIGAAGAVFAQDDVENQFDSDPAGDIDGMDDVYDIDAPAVYPEKPAKSGKKSGKSGKSKSKKKAEAAAGDDDVLNAAVYDNDPANASESSKSGKPPKSKSKSGKSGKPSKSDKSSTASGAVMKYNGLVAAGVDFNRKVNRKEGNETESKRIVKGELELSAQPVKKVRAEIGLEYNINGRTMVADSLRKYDPVPIDPNASTWVIPDVDLIKGLALGPFAAVDKIYVQYSIVDNGAVRAGIMKKSFGLEERAGLDERPFLKRSIVSDGLEELGFLDHDLTAAYRHDLLKDALRLTGAFSWSIADSLVYLQNYSAQCRPAENMEIVLAGIVKHNTDTTGGNPSTTYAASLSFKYEAAAWCVGEAELTFGVNPQIWAAEYKKTALFGARLQERFPIDVNAKILRRVIPAIGAAVYAADLDSGRVDTQIRAGVTLGFAKNSAFQFRNNFGTVIRTENGASRVKRYRFDSEAVVIF